MIMTVISFDNIPDALRRTPQWVLWRYERKNGQRTKVPYQCNGSKASSTNPATWASFDTVRSTLEQGGNFSGCGFVLTAEDNFVGIDLDHCLDPDTGEINADARNFMESLPTYWEFSPSGEGIRGFAIGQLPPGGRKRGNVEMYHTRRFLTVTGRRLTDVSEPLEATEILRSLHARYFGSDPSESTRTNEQNPVLAIGDIRIDRNATVDPQALAGLRRDSLFDATWQFRRPELPSTSEHDMSLAMSAAEAGWSGQEIANLLLQFRRENSKDLKLKNPQYYHRTIARALQGTTQSRDKYNLTDLGNVDRFVEASNDHLRFVTEEQTWLRWDGVHWRPTAESQIHDFSREVVRRMDAEADEEMNDGRRKEIRNHARASENRAKFEAMQVLAAKDPRIAVPASGRDRDSFLLGVANGTLDLRTGTLRAGEKGDLITRVSPVTFDPSARAPRFDQFVDEVCGGDRDFSAFLQRSVGYILTGDTSEQVLFYLHGRGANGKSTLLEMMQSLLPQHTKVVQSNTFMKEGFGSTGGAPREDIARLQGCRLVITTEVGETERVDEAIVKQLTGGDTVNARFPYAKRSIEFRPSFKICIAGNYRPYIYGTDDGIWRRILLLPFTQQFDVSRRDPNLRAKLLAELPGILNWALEGCLQWQAQGLSPPELILRQTLEYRKESDLMGMFLEDCCDVSEPRVFTMTATLHREYEQWCLENGIKNPLATTSFGRKLVDRGFRRHSNGTGRGFYGVQPKRNERTKLKGTGHSGNVWLLHDPNAPVPPHILNSTTRS